MSRTRLYRNGELVDHGFPVTDVARHLQDPGSVVWLDLCAPSQDEIGLLRDELGLHELAIEDAFAERQRPKVDRYPSHLFLSVYAVRYDDLCRVTGKRHDPCMLDTFIAAVRFMGGEPAKPWWKYTAERKKELKSRRERPQRPS